MSMSITAPRVTSILLSLLLGACGSDASTDPDAGIAEVDANPSADAGPVPDLTAAMFDPDTVLDIAIEMDPDDWESLRHQTRSILDVLGASCLEEPPTRPFTYFASTVTVNGDVVTNVGVRKKGFFGSLSTTKPSLKVKFSEYLDDQRYSGMQRLTLNNAISDGSFVKQCLGYALFADAGVPAPRCNFATVSVNGESLGLYVHVESIKKRFLARHFSDNDGNLYEGALSDFRPGWVDTFQRKTNHEDLDRSDIEALVPAMSTSDDDLLAALEPLIDVDAFIDMWATELLIMHADGYARNTNNFYLYRESQSGRFNFIPWGIDSIMFADTTLSWEDELPPTSVWAEGVLSRRLYHHPETRARYYDRLETLLDDWDETALVAEIDRMEELIAPHVEAAATTNFAAAVDGVRDFVNGRRATIESALASEDPAWAGELRDPWCIDEIGTVSATFSTTFGTITDEDVFASGSGTLNVTVDGVAFVPVNIGSKSGYDEESGEPAIQVVAWLDDDTALILHMVIPDRDNFASGTLPVDWTTVSGYVVRILFPPGSDPVGEVVGMLGEGTLWLTEAGTTPGATVSGSMSTILYESLW
jgi:spore coat protein H